jgi:AcrR family transcriptional regulator
MARLATEGLEGLTMRRLAKDLGCTEPALYRYFPSKDALLAALTEQVVERLGELFERGLERTDQPLVRVALVAEIYAALMREHRGEATLLTMVLGDPRYLVDRDASLPTLRAMERVLARVAAALSDAVNEGALSDGDAMTRGVSLWTAAHGAAQLRKFDRFGVTHLGVTRARRATLSDLLTAWGASPAESLPALERATAVAAELVPTRVSDDPEEE